MAQARGFGAFGHAFSRSSILQIVDRLVVVIRSEYELT